MSNKHHIKRTKRRKLQRKPKDIPLPDLLAAKRAANKQHSK